jgi:hypothetical protein
MYVKPTFLMRPTTESRHDETERIPPGKRRSHHLSPESFVASRKASNSVWPARPILGMPLHREHKALSRQLQGLYYVVWCSCDDHKAARHLFHALMVA